MPRDMRVGRWVQTPDGIGVVADMGAGRISVDFVGPDGNTEHSRRFPASEITLADLDAIPDSRRNPKPATLSDPISDEENEQKTAAIARGEFKE
jgi:hypothetical protein